jgi:hypothetical protein
MLLFMKHNFMKTKFDYVQCKIVQCKIHSRQKGGCGSNQHLIARSLL